MKRDSIFVCVVIIFLLMCCLPIMSIAKGNDKTAIVLTSFGSSYPKSLSAILNIEDEVKKAFPDVMIKHAFTSSIIRKTWQKRRNDRDYISNNKNISEKFLYIKGPLAIIADLQDQGYKNIIVQPTHIFAGEEYADLCSYINGLNSIKTLKLKFIPFHKLAIGRPALGRPGHFHPYHKDIQNAARVLKKDATLARSKKAALVYMGHGNKFYSTGAYVVFQHEMNRMYPDVKTLVGVVEGFPGIDDVVKSLKHMDVKKVVLKPFMIVAGDHANNDMAGDEEGTWKKILEKQGIEVTCILKGLGENKDFARIFADYIKDVIKDNQIKIH